MGPRPFRRAWWSHSLALACCSACQVDINTLVLHKLAPNQGDAAALNAGGADDAGKYT
jgi:hypothetical protein